MRRRALTTRTFEDAPRPNPAGSARQGDDRVKGSGGQGGAPGTCRCRRRTSCAAGWSRSLIFLSTTFSSQAMLHGCEPRDQMVPGDAEGLEGRTVFPIVSACSSRLMDEVIRHPSGGEHRQVNAVPVLAQMDSRGNRHQGQGVCLREVLALLLTVTAACGAATVWTRCSRRCVRCTVMDGQFQRQQRLASCLGGLPRGRGSCRWVCNRRHRAIRRMVANRLRGNASRVRWRTRASGGRQWRRFVGEALDYEWQRRSNSEHGALLLHRCVASMVVPGPGGRRRGMTTEGTLDNATIDMGRSRGAWHQTMHRGDRARGWAGRRGGRRRRHAPGRLLVYTAFMTLAFVGFRFGEADNPGPDEARDDNDPMDADDAMHDEVWDDNDLQEFLDGIGPRFLPADAGVAGMEVHDADAHATEEWGDACCEHPFVEPPSEGELPQAQLDPMVVGVESACHADQCMGRSVAFVQADCFQGAWIGRVFKYGQWGLGYYRDDKLVADRCAGPHVADRGVVWRPPAQCARVPLALDVLIPDRRRGDYDEEMAPERDIPPALDLERSPDDDDADMEKRDADYRRGRCHGTQWRRPRRVPHRRKCRPGRRGRGARFHAAMAVAAGAGDEPPQARPMPEEVASVAHRAEGLWAFDTVNASGWRGAASYLERTGADFVLHQEVKRRRGQHATDAEAIARSLKWSTAIESAVVTAPSDPISVSLHPAA